MTATTAPGINTMTRTSSFERIACDVQLEPVLKMRPACRSVTTARMEELQSLAEIAKNAMLGSMPYWGRLNAQNAKLGDSKL